MAQHEASSRILAGMFILIGLILVWVTIVTSLPSQQELTAGEPVLSSHAWTVSTNATGQIAAGGPVTAITPEPVLDLSIPGVSSAVPSVPDGNAGNLSNPQDTASVESDPRIAQATHLKCAAEIEQLCPDSLDGPARTRCLERRSKTLAPSCQSQLRERFVKWKEDRSRIVAACDGDVKRLCATVNPGDGRMVQCLHEHAQDVSDRCYRTLPKGALFFTR